MSQTSIMCDNDACPMRVNCLRYCAVPMRDQKYEHFEPKEDEYGTMSCEHHIMAGKVVPMKKKE